MSILKPKKQKHIKKMLEFIFLLKKGNKMNLMDYLAERIQPSIDKFNEFEKYKEALITFVADVKNQLEYTLPKSNWLNNSQYENVKKIISFDAQSKIEYPCLFQIFSSLSTKIVLVDMQTSNEKIFYKCEIVAKKEETMQTIGEFYISEDMKIHKKIQWEPSNTSTDEFDCLVSFLDLIDFDKAFEFYCHP